ncbi:MAG: DUF169 domain-containing protein [Solirubrobacteraceae bacterium]
MTITALGEELDRLLDLEHPPVAITFHEQEPPEELGTRPGPVPAGCCLWAQAEHRRLHTTAADHAHCSVGSYAHGLISLADAAAAQDSATLVGSGWVTEAGLANAPTVATTPTTITYERLDQVEDADVVLVRLTASSLMSLQGACPELSLVTKPQCQIIPLALEGAIAVSPGCAVSRVRTGQPENELTCALPARELAEIVARLAHSVAADETVRAHADADLRRHFTASS